MKHGRDGNDRRGPGADERGDDGSDVPVGKQSLVELIDPISHGPPGTGRTAPPLGVGKQSLVDREFGVVGGSRAPQPHGPSREEPLPGSAYIDSLGPVIQRKATGGAAADGAAATEAASRGVQGGGGQLPYLAQIQASFGQHDVSGVSAHQGPAASEASQQLGAQAYAFGNSVAFGASPDLHTAAHEAAHVVQQRGGVQLKGGVGEAGDPYERHADAVADRVVAGRSAEDLLDGGAAGGASHVVQRKETKDDAQILEHQASLKGTDVEIPALEGALLATRIEAVKRGILTKASFDAGLELSKTMAQLQPAVADKGAVNKDVQAAAAIAAQQLFAALQHETAHDDNFQLDLSASEGTSVASHNPYTGEHRVTTYILVWIASQITVSGFQHLPELIRQGNWEAAFRGYRGLVEGLDLWVADQLRKKGKGTPEEGLGNAQEYYSQLRTGLEQIADKHAKRLPALFHPDSETVEKEKAAGRPAADTIPMNVYVWKDDKDGKYHLYDVTTPSHPQEQTLDGPPTAAVMNTFFEEVARYPKGEVRYTLPGGGAGVAPTTGKIKWFEWIGYAGMAVAAVGLALATGGASIPATVCFAAGAAAGAISAAGHLADSERLGTATTTTIVIDVAQMVASLATLGALNVTVKGSMQYFVAVAGTADGVQLVALGKVTLQELDKIQNSPGKDEDKQRAAAVLLTQLMVAGGMTALSVPNIRNARSLKGQSLELIDQNGAKVLRGVAEITPEPIPHAENSVTGSEHGAATGGHQPVAHDTSPAPPAQDERVPSAGLRRDSHVGAVAPARAVADLTPADVDNIIKKIKASGRVTGDLSVLDKVAREAKTGEPGKLGELEAIQRWLSGACQRF